MVVTADAQALALAAQIEAQKRLWDAANLRGDKAAMTAANQAANALREHLRTAGYSSIATAAEQMGTGAFSAYRSSISLVSTPGGQAQQSVAPIAPVAPGVLPATPPAIDPLLGQAGSVVGQVVTGATSAVSTAWTWGTANWRTIAGLIALALVAKMLKLRLNLGGGKK